MIAGVCIIPHSSPSEHPSESCYLLPTGELTGQCRA